MSSVSDVIRAVPKPPVPVSVQSLPLPAAAGGAAKAPTPPKLRPPVRSSFVRLRHYLITLSFLVCVIVPSIASGIYLWAVAMDQYASRVGFSVRREDAGSPTDMLRGLTSFSGSSSSDTDILFEYLRSQRLVSEMDGDIGLRDRWSKYPSDPIFSLEGDASIEELMKYWTKMVRVSYSKGTGLIEVEVRAFAAEDATLIAQTLFAKSSQMINDLTAVARQDSIRFTKVELTDAEDRLRQARETLTRFRNVNRIVDPQLDIRNQSGLLAKLQDQKASALIELDLLRKTARDGDPRIEQAQLRLEVIEERIAQERLELGGSGQMQRSADQGFADLIGEYERLVVDREFAQETYISARAAHDSALSEATRKSRYLAAYMEPTRAQTAAYPERVTLQTIMSLFLFLIWGVAVLVYYSVKDRR